MAEGGEKPMIILGADPGTTNPGFAWYDPKYEKALMCIHDIHCWDGYRHKLQVPYDYNEAMIRVVDAMDHQLMMRTTHLAFERMDHPRFNKNVRAAWPILEQTIRVRYPHIVVGPVRPEDVRAFLDLQGGVEYDERKEDSWNTPVLFPEDRDRAKQVFKKSDGKHVDGVEALNIAVFAYHHRETVFAPRVHLRTRPCADGHLSMRIHVAPTIKVDLPPTGKKKTSKKRMISAANFDPDSDAIPQVKRKRAAPKKKGNGPKPKKKAGAKKKKAKGG